MAQNSVKVKNYLNIFEEYVAAGAITPGMLIELGSAGTVVAHNSAGAIAFPMFALEDELQGNDIDDAYASGDRVQCWIPQRGDQVYALLANGEDVSIGDFLVSDGAGRLKALSSETADETVVAVALEAVDMSDSSAADPTGRIIVRTV